MDVALLAPYDKEIRSLLPVGPVLDRVQRELQGTSRSLSGYDREDADAVIEEIEDLGPALGYAHEQVRRSAAERGRDPVRGWCTVVPMVVPEKYEYVLRHWASVGRTFDAAVGVLGRATDSGRKLEEYKLAMEFLQKRIAEAFYLRS